jgi:hypothetical protein
VAVIALHLASRAAPLFAALGVVVQCAHAAPAPLASTQAAVQTTEENVRALRRDHPEVQVQMDTRGDRIRRLTGLTVTGPTDGTPESVAMSALKDRSISRALGLSADLRELCHPLTRSDPSQPNRAIVRVQQCAGPLRVMGAELVMNVRMGESSGVETLTSSLATPLPENRTPAVTPAAARQAAADALQKLKPPPGTPIGGELREPELIVFDPRIFGLPGLPRLCWLVGNGRVATVIDAATGEVVHQYSEIVRGQ